MSYDPSNDPRWVPLEDLDDAEQGEHYAAVLNKLEATIDRCDAMLQMFETPGWAYLTGEAMMQSDELDHRLARETDPSDWKLLRGQKIQADWLVQLPVEITEKVKKLRRAYAEIINEFRQGQASG